MRLEGERLRGLWREHGAHPALRVIDTVFTAVESFRGRAVQSDDMTLLVVGPAPRPAA